MDLSRFNKAGAKLQSLAANNAPYGSRVSAEIEYREAYQQLVRARIMPQIRKKYR